MAAKRPLKVEAPAEPNPNKVRLEAAVTRASRAIIDIIRAVEKGAADLSADDVEKAFAAIQVSLVSSHGRSKLSLSAFAAANGFSLDKALPAVVAAPALVAHPLQHVPPAAPAAPSVGGRFVREARERREGAPAPHPAPPAADIDDDDGDGAVFIDD